MTNTRRLDKVSSLLKKEISLILMNDLEDILIIDNFVSVTNIEVSKDLQSCKIFINCSADENMKNQIVENLNFSKNRIRYLLGKRIKMRRIPDLDFKKDRVLDEGLSVLKLLDQLREGNNLDNKSKNENEK